MKEKLLLLFLFTVFYGYSQTLIQQFHSTNGSQFTVMSGTIDQSASGAGVTWDFTNLNPTSQVLTDRFTDNGATSIIETLDGGNVESTLNLATNMSELSITGLLSQGFNINYSNSAIIGAFPLAFNFSSTDGLEGSVSGNGIAGSILNTSTITVNVDAWGTLKVGNFDGEVTRLRIVQDLDFNVFFNTFPGTITSIYYYDANSNDIVFRFNRLEIDAPGNNIDQIVLESLSTNVLSNPEIDTIITDVSIITSPDENVIQFRADNRLVLNTVRIFDVTGRSIIEQKITHRRLDITTLKSGIYVAVVETSRGVISKRFVKR